MSNTNENAERHEFADILDNMTRDELQTLCETLLDNDKRILASWRVLRRIAVDRRQKQ